MLNHRTLSTSPDTCVLSSLDKRRAPGVNCLTGSNMTVGGVMLCGVSNLLYIEVRVNQTFQKHQTKGKLHPPESRLCFQGILTLILSIINNLNTTSSRVSLTYLNILSGAWVVVKCDLSQCFKTVDSNLHDNPICLHQRVRDEGTERFTR